MNKKFICNYIYGLTLPGCTAPESSHVNAFRDMDFIKSGKKIGTKVQFGKYPFTAHYVCAKITIFKKLGHIDVGIEIVPVKYFANEMSTMVSYFEQFAWDLEHRGGSDIDIPVSIPSIDSWFHKKSVIMFQVQMDKK